MSSMIQAIEASQFPLLWKGHWVGSTWKKPQTRHSFRTSQSPNNGELLVEYHIDEGDIQSALQNAVQAFPTFSKIPLRERLELLKTFTQRLADAQHGAKRALRVEAGKPKWEADLELDAAMTYLKWMVEHGESLMENLCRPLSEGLIPGDYRLIPLGVGAAYLPYSTPLTTFAHYYGAAVLTGCPLVVVGSGQASLTTLLLSELAEACDGPRGHLNLLCGHFQMFKILAQSRGIAVVLYTGSREHCDEIRRDPKLFAVRQLVLQSGGKNAAIVDESCDLKRAVAQVAHGCLRSAGQLCSTTSRVFVHKSISSSFLEQMSAVFSTVKIGPTDQSDSAMMGPMYAPKAVDKYLRFQTMGSREAKETPLRGAKRGDYASGCFVSPGIHLMKSFDPQSAYQKNVVFGPDLCIYEFSDIEAAVYQVNATDAAFVVSYFGPLEILEGVREQLLAPNLMYELPTVESEAALPLAGRVKTGYHRFHGPAIALYFTYPQILQKRLNRPIIGPWKGEPFGT